MFESLSELYSEDKEYFKNMFNDSFYNTRYSKGLWGDKMIPRNYSLFYAFENEWRKPLNVCELFLFKILCQIPVESQYNLISHLFCITKEKTFTDFKYLTLSLRSKGYVKFVIKYKKNKMYSFKRDHFFSRMKMYCYDPKGNVVNADKISEPFKRID